jgi:hypothetical protein
MHALFVTYDGKSGKLHTEAGDRVVVACGASELWSLRMLASSLRCNGSASVIEVELHHYDFETVSIRHAAA